PSTARGWLGTAPTVVVSLEVADLTELELRQEVLTLRRRVQKLAALLRLALVLLRVSGFTLSGERLLDGSDKLRILRAIDQARAGIPLRALLRLLRLSPSRFHAWRRPRLRVHPVKPKIGLRTTRPNEMWHIDTTVIRLLDGTRAYMHAVIDNFSRRILAWRVAETFAPVNSVAVLLDAGRAASPS